MPKKLRIFLDASALIAGLNSSTGAANLIISNFLAGNFLIYISNQIIEETEQAIQEKFPLLQDVWHNFLLSQPKIVSDPAIKEISNAYKLIKTDDAPILAAAIKTAPDFLITWDIKHFLKQEVKESLDFIICTPKQFIQEYWRI